MQQCELMKLAAEFVKFAYKLLGSKSIFSKQFEPKLKNETLTRFFSKYDMFWTVYWNFKEIHNILDQQFPQNTEYHKFEDNIHQIKFALQAMVQALWSIKQFQLFIEGNVSLEKLIIGTMKFLMSMFYLYIMFIFIIL